MQEIVIPFDLSEFAVQAAHWGAEFAVRIKVDIVLFHSVEAVKSADGKAAHIDEEAVADVQLLMEEFAMTLSTSVDHRVNVRTLVRKGDPSIQLNIYCFFHEPLVAVLNGALFSSTPSMLRRQFNTWFQKITWPVMVLSRNSKLHSSLRIGVVDTPHGTLSSVTSMIIQSRNSKGELSLVFISKGTDGAKASINPSLNREYLGNPDNKFHFQHVNFAGVISPEIVENFLDRFALDILLLNPVHKHHSFPSFFFTRQYEKHESVNL